MERLLQLPGFKDFTQEVVDIAKTMVRLQRIEAEEDRTKIEMRGVGGECIWKISWKVIGEDKIHWLKFQLIA